MPTRSTLTWQTLLQILFFSLAACVHSAIETRFAFPMLFLPSKNEVKSTQLDLGAGFAADFFLKQQGRFVFGPGLALLGTMPTTRSNHVVAVRPYNLLAELHVAMLYQVFGERRGFVPYFSVGPQVGILLIKKTIAETHALEIDPVFGVSASLGFSCWFDAIGVGVSYGIIPSTHALKHKLELSLQFAVASTS